MGELQVMTLTESNTVNLSQLQIQQTLKCLTLLESSCHNAYTGVRDSQQRNQQQNWW